MSRLNRPLPNLLHLYLALLVAFGVALPSPARAQLPDPQPLPPTGNCYDDNIFYGAVPPDSAGNPVLVFVHGYGGLASDWWVNVPGVQVNDAYSIAYAAGYRTAFVNVNVDPSAANCAVVRRPSIGVVASGDALKQQLDSITAHYGVAQVDIIAHSKGGVDTQAAIVLSGAAPMVRKVFTLSSPHHGTSLADLLWSPEGAWLSLIIGRDDGTGSLRVASMQTLRTTLDASEVDDQISYYTAGGSGWKKASGLSQYTGLFLQSYEGDNDGLVSVASSRLPGATELFVKDLTHTEMGLGQNALPEIWPMLGSQLVTPTYTVYLPLVTQPVPSGTAVRVPPQSIATNTTLHSQTIVRGGQLSSAAEELVPIESHVRAATWTLFASDEHVTATVRAPDGTAHQFAAVSDPDAAMFGITTSLGYRALEPSPGGWSLQVHGPAGAAYLLVVSLDSPWQIDLDGFPAASVAPDTGLHLRARAAGAVQQIRLQATRPRDERAAVSRLAIAQSSGAMLAYGPDQPGTHTLSVRVQGVTPDGFAFERTFVRSLAVVPTTVRAVSRASLQLLMER